MTTYSIEWSRRARADLIQIGDYIARDNPDAANRWVDLLIKDVERAAELPLAGRPVPEFAERQYLREVLRRTYRVVYEVRDRSILVLTIFEGHRLLPEAALSDDDE